MNPHEVLVAARNLLDREGWAQLRVFFGSRGPGCSVGAIHHVAFKAEAYDAKAFATDALYEAIGRPVCPDAATECPAVLVGRWNDTPGRTKDEVLAAFDRAISATAPPPQDLDLEVPVEQPA